MKNFHKVEESTLGWDKDEFKLGSWDWEVRASGAAGYFALLVCSAQVAILMSLADLYKEKAQVMVLV